jgi:hypothetical protein
LKPAVREAGQHGADAVIVIVQDVETRGYSTTSFANANSNTNFSGVANGNGFFGNAQYYRQRLWFQLYDAGAAR